MNGRSGSIALRSAIVVAFAAAAVLLWDHDRSNAAPTLRTNTAAQRKSVSLTVYDDFAVIRDERTVDLAQGTNRIAFGDIAPQIQPQTAFFTDVASAHPVWVNDQYLDSAVLTANSLYLGAVDHHVWVITVDNKTGQETSRRQAILVSTDGPILRFPDHVENQLPPNSRIAYLSLPNGYRTKPALVASLGSSTANRPDLAFYYTTGGFSWTTDYLADLNAASDHMDINAVATVNNQSGLAFDNALLSFVSGSVHRIQSYAPETSVLGRVTTVAASAMNNPDNRAVRQALLDNYLYTVPHLVSLDDKQTKQITLFTAEAVPVSFVYEIDDQNPPDYTSANGDAQTLLIDSYIAFSNEGKGLGIPLPAGIVHMYKTDATGNDQFVGEDTINLTPRNAAIRLDVGQPFDIKADRVQTSFQSVDQVPPVNRLSPERTFYYSDYRITLNNGKAKSANVNVIETMSGEWQINRESLTHTRLDSTRVEWTVPVPALGSTMLTYSVVVKSPYS
jgi:hypothetical protein